MKTSDTMGRVHIQFIYRQDMCCQVYCCRWMQERLSAAVKNRRCRGEQNPETSPEGTSTNSNSAVHKLEWIFTTANSHLYEPLLLLRSTQPIIFMITHRPDTQRLTPLVPPRQIPLTMSPPNQGVSWRSIPPTATQPCTTRALQGPSLSKV